MSNYSYYPNTRSVQKYKPISWNANKNKNTGNSTKKDFVYHHPNGDYTRYKDGRRLRWLQYLYIWKEIDNSNSVIPGGITISSDEPNDKMNTIVECKQNPNHRGAVTTYKPKKKCKCSYCGENLPYDDLCIYILDDVNGIAGYDIFCQSCGLEMEAYGLGEPRPNYDIDYHVTNKKLLSLQD